METVLPHRLVLLVIAENRVVHFRNRLDHHAAKLALAARVTAAPHTPAAILKSEIKTFNTGMAIVGNPYWLSSEANRGGKVTGSVCIAFATEQEVQQAMRKPLYLLGISVRAEKIHSTPPSTQCAKCQGFGHTDKKCRKSTACKMCDEAHLTAVHKCNTCGAKGKKCAHTVPKCANCRETRSADNRECEIFLAVKKACQLRRHHRGSPINRRIRANPGSQPNCLENREATDHHDLVLPRNVAMDIE